MIVVFGSLNLDFVTRVERLPGPGETVLGPECVTHPGGKGANQALAAARAGARTLMAGAVGDDGFADLALDLLRRADLDLSRVARVSAATGAAFITVDAGGANQIVVATGANSAAKADQLEGIGWSKRDILLMQCETPATENRIAARQAKAAGARVILNLAPAGTPDPALLQLIDILIVNEHEALTLAQGLGWAETAPDAICERLDRERGVAAVATLGANGVVGWWGGVRRALPAYAVDVVDTTAAGDAFAGSFAAALDRGLGFTQALQWGLAAGSLACTVRGAQPSLPLQARIAALVGEGIV
jgi:ribokinase